MDGGEYHWWRRLQEYYDRGRFALQFSLDGVRTGPIGDRGLTLLCPVDALLYENLPHSQRPIWCGFNGGIHAGRPEIVYPLRDRDLLVYRPREVDEDHSVYRRFLGVCKVGLNVSTTGGVIGGDHVKYRAGGELPAAGCLVLETQGSPLDQWYTPGEDYLEYENVEDAASKLRWVRENPAEAESMAQRMRAKVVAEHSPEVFWSQVFERLGLGPALVAPRELTWRHWVWPHVSSCTRLPPPRDGHTPWLIESVGGYNLVGMNGHVYAVPQSIGSVDLDKVDLVHYADIRRFVNLDVARRELQ